MQTANAKALMCSLERQQTLRPPSTKSRAFPYIESLYSFPGNCSLTESDKHDLSFFNLTEKRENFYIYIKYFYKNLKSIFNVSNI